jgi:hypothetical protein
MPWRKVFLAGLMMFTILPFISIFMTALHPLVALISIFALFSAGYPFFITGL